jgi:hypothetical protein
MRLQFGIKRNGGGGWLEIVENEVNARGRMWECD